MPKNYTDINSAAIDQWVRDGWEWGQEISHETYLRAKQGDWSVLLTPTKPVPKEWFCPMQGAKILGLASGGVRCARRAVGVLNRRLSTVDEVLDGIVPVLRGLLTVKRAAQDIECEPLR